MFRGGVVLIPPFCVYLCKRLKYTIMENFKKSCMAFIGLLVGFLFVMCAVGSFGYLVYDGHYVFAVANVVTVLFAAKPVREFFVKHVIL